MANARLGWFSPLGVAAGRVRSSAFRFGDCPQRVGLRAHCFRFSVRTASGLPSAGWFFHSSGWFFRLPLRKLPSAGWPSGLLLRSCRSAGWPSGSPLPLFGTHRFGVALGGLAFGLTASDFRHAPLRSCRWASWPSGFCFGNCPRRVDSSARRLVFGLIASAFRHAPIRSGCWASSFFRLPFRSCRSAGWPSGSLLPLFGMRRFGVAAGRVGLRAHCFRFSACTDSHRRAAEARTDGAQRHDNCFTSKHLSQHVNLPHRTP